VSVIWSFSVVVLGVLGVVVFGVLECCGVSVGVALTLALSQRERELTELFWRVTPT
jgi:site-specific recombinase